MMGRGKVANEMLVGEELCPEGEELMRAERSGVGVGGSVCVCVIG